MPLGEGDRSAVFRVDGMEVVDVAEASEAGSRVDIEFVAELCADECNLLKVGASHPLARDGVGFRKCVNAWFRHVRALLPGEKIGHERANAEPVCHEGGDLTQEDDPRVRRELHFRRAREVAKEVIRGDGQHDRSRE